MGKKLKIREAQKRAEEQALFARLRASTRTKVRPGFISSFCDFAPPYRAKIERYRPFALRAPEDWTSGVRARSPELRFVDLVKFVFTRFPVVRHLELAWTSDLEPAGADGGAATAADATGRGRAPFELGGADPCRWYILAGQGKSLYNEATHPFISKRETHYFLNAPAAVTSTVRAFWFAVAMAAGENAEVAERVSRTKLAGYPIEWKFWKDVARFFAVNPIPVLEMNDLIDYCQAARDLDDTFEVHGRTLNSLRRRKAQWHQMLRDTAQFDDDKWPGRPMPDTVYRTEGEKGSAIWRIHQLTTGNELLREGVRMQHCVHSYKSRCMNALSSIWSLTCEYPVGSFHRGLTIEVDDLGAMVQIRGFANRLPDENELAVLRRWAGDFGLSM